LSVVAKRKFQLFFLQIAGKENTSEYVPRHTLLRKHDVCTGDLQTEWGITIQIPIYPKKIQREVVKRVQAQVNYCLLMYSNIASFFDRSEIFILYFNILW